MIGNLLLLACTAFLGCSCAFGLQESTKLYQSLNEVSYVPTQYVSQQNGSTYDLYYNFNSSFPKLTNTSEHQDIFYTLDLNTQSYSVLYDYTNNGYSISNYNDAYDLYYDNSDWTDYYIYISYAFESNVISDGATTTTCIMRFFVPSNSPVDFIEYTFGHNYKMCFGNYSSNKVGFLEPPNKHNWQNITDTTLISSSELVSMAVPRFYQYLFCFEFTNEISSFDSMPFNIYFCGGSLSKGLAFQQGYNQGFEDGRTDGYQSGLSDGYNQGFTEGNAQGYQNGYSEGIAFASGQTSFNALFGAIADTPVVFLRSLFNFDLFGMNMFIIIMSLLTGIVVMFVIKKVWK